MYFNIILYYTDAKYYVTLYYFYSDFLFFFRLTHSLKHICTHGRLKFYFLVRRKIH